MVTEFIIHAFSPPVKVFPPYPGRARLRARRSGAARHLVAIFPFLRDLHKKAHPGGIAHRGAVLYFSAFYRAAKSSPARGERAIITTEKLMEDTEISVARRSEGIMALRRASVSS